MWFHYGLYESAANSIVKADCIAYT